MLRQLVQRGRCSHGKGRAIRCDMDGRVASPVDDGMIGEKKKKEAFHSFGKHVVGHVRDGVIAVGFL